MKKIYLTYFLPLLLLIVFSCDSKDEPQNSPVVLNIDIYLSSDDELADFTALNVNEVEGDLHIESMSITDLSDLESLEKVGGDLFIGFNENLVSVKGLDNLKTIGGSFHINGESPIVNLSGLENLETIGEDFLIDIGYNVKTITGFNSLKEIGGNMRFYKNFSLVYLPNFTSLQSIGGNLDLYETYSLISVEGFQNLTTIGGDLIIKSCANLFSLKGLDSIQQIVNLDVTYNKSLTDFCALQRVEITGNTTIEFNTYNPSLEEIQNGGCAKGD
ncbi:MAG: hypothetical protein ACPHXR_08375 [Flavicella sp.]